MKIKVLALTILLGTAILIFSSVSPAFAAEAVRGGPGNGGGAGGNGGGGNGNQGAIGIGTGMPVKQSINLDGAQTDLFHANLATSLGFTDVEELTARLDAGETISEIALSLGFDSAAISDMLTQARSDALDQAVVDGLITQEQADWLASRGRHGVCDYTGVCLADGMP